MLHAQASEREPIDQFLAALRSLPEVQAELERAAAPEHDARLALDVAGKPIHALVGLRKVTWPRRGAAPRRARLLIRDASARCAAILLRLAGRGWTSGPDTDLPSETPASQRELAMLCNVSRNTFSRVVKEFSSRRLVTLNYRSLTVNDPSRLRVVADAG